MITKQTITTNDNYPKDIHFWHSDPNRMSTGCSMYEAKDGGLVLVLKYNEDPEVFHAFKTFDNFYTVAEEWFIEDGGSENIMRLPDGRLMSVVGEVVENAVGNSLKAENFYAYFSEDDGKTFGNRVTISAENRRLYLMNARPRVLSTGRIITPMGIHPNHLLEAKNETVGWVNAFYSDDNGQTWTEGEWHEPVCVDQLCEPMIAEMPDGSLKMLCRTGVGYLYQLDSTDGGQTWGNEYPTTLRSPCAPFTFTYDPHGERFIVVWDDAFPAAPYHQYPRSPICVATSKDCKTWTKLFELGSDPNRSYGYPAVHCGEDFIYIGFYMSADRTFSKTNRVTCAIVSRNVHPELCGDSVKVRNITTDTVSRVPSKCLIKDRASTVSEFIESTDGSLIFNYAIEGGGEYLFKTRDNGKTFDAPVASNGSEVNMIRLKDGRIMGLISRRCLEHRGAKLNGANFWARFSDDEGVTFKDAVPITKRDGCYYVQNSRYLRTSSGRILLPVCLHDASELDQKLETAGWVTCFYSDDEGQTWTEGPWVKPAYDQLCECMVAEMRDKGHIKMYSRTARGYIYGCDSYDDGATWGPEYQTELKNPCSPFTFKYDPYSDLYYVLHNNSFPALHHTYPRSPMTLSVSYDCEHWENIVEIGFEQDCSYGYPCIHFTEDELLIGYYRCTLRVFCGRNRVHFMRLPRTVHEKLKSK